MKRGAHKGCALMNESIAIKGRLIVSNRCGAFNLGLILKWKEFGLKFNERPRFKRLFTFSFLINSTFMFHLKPMIMESV